jgi:two-component system, LytTR family, response regulator
MISIAIDDEPLALEVIRSHAAKVPFLELNEVFTDAFKALDYLQHNQVDLIFLDIKMPDISGIEFYNTLTKKPMVIFTTAYSEHAVTGFELDAVDYLLKPFSLTRFLKACTKANEFYQLKTSNKITDHIFIKTGYEQVKVMFDEILYLEAEGNYISFVTKSNRLLTRMTFMEVENLLPHGNFIRIHRSFIAAKNHIDKIERYQVFIKGVAIPVGDSYMQNLSFSEKRK